MADLQTLIRDEMDRASSPSYTFDDLWRRRDRKRRNQRIAAGVLGIIVAILSLMALTSAFRGAERPASEPTPAPRPPGIFSNIGGWIVYGHIETRSGGIFAVDPTQPNDPKARILVSSRGGEPLGWSSDGSRLLIRREVTDAKRDPTADLDLFILNAGGTETRVTRSRDWPTGSISPDGSQVVYVAELAGNMYLVDSEGGEPRLLLARTRRRFPEEGRSFRTWLYNPTFSPDGSLIAYFDGLGDWGHSLRVMNADGSGIRILIDKAPQEVGHVDDLVWSPDGSRLAFSAGEGGIWIVNLDGSGLTKVIPDATNPAWSPDGSRISYQSVYPPALGTLEIAAVDGTHVQEFGYGGSGPWNPQPLLVADKQDVASTPGESRSALFVSTIVLVLVVSVVVLLRRARRKIVA